MHLQITSSWFLVTLQFRSCSFIFLGKYEEKEINIPKFTEINEYFSPTIAAKTFLSIEMQLLSSFEWVRIPCISSVEDRAVSAHTFKSPVMQTMRAGAWNRPTALYCYL